MTIQTKFYGEVSIAEIKRWQFPKGLPGFEEEKEFVLLSIEGNDMFQVLQSTVTASIAFIVANPYILIEDYSFSIDTPTLDLLEIKREEDVVVLAVVSMKQPFEESTVNLQSPLIFNTTNQKAKQMILNDSQFLMRHPLKTLIKGGN